MPSNQKLRTRPDLKRPELEIDEMELSSSDDDGEAKTTGFTSSSNLIAMSSVRKASYANKLQHLNGLSTSYPPGDFLKLPLEENSGVTSHTQGQCPQPDAYKASREDAAEIFEGESFVSQALAHGSVEKLSAAAPVFRSSPNGSSAKLPLSHAKEGARPVDVSIDSNRITGMSFISSRKSFSPPFASSGRPFSPLLGSRLQPIPLSEDCMQTNDFQAALYLSRTADHNEKLIINIDDSDSEEERPIAKPVQILSRGGVDQVKAAGGRPTSGTHTLACADSDVKRRVKQTNGVRFTNTTLNTKTGPIMRPALISKLPPPRTETKIETLRQLDAAKENKFLQRNRVSRLSEPRSKASPGVLEQGSNEGTQRISKASGINVAVNRSSRTLKRKLRPANAAFIDLVFGSFQSIDAELTECGARNVCDADLTPKSSDFQSSTGIPDEIAMNQQADYSVKTEKNSETCSFGISKESKNIVSCGDFSFSKASTAAESSRTTVCGGTVAAPSVEPPLFGIKVVEFGTKNTSGIQEIESGVTESRNVEKIQISFQNLTAEKVVYNNFANVPTVGTPTLPGRSCAAISSGILSELHLESTQLRQTRSSSLKRRVPTCDESTEQKKEHSWDQSSDTLLSILARPGPDSLSRVANHIVADDDKMLLKRRRIDEHVRRARDTEHAAANSLSFSFLSKQRSRPQSCSPGPPSTGHVKHRRDESRSFCQTNAPVSVSYIHVHGQHYQHAQKHCAQDGVVSSGILKVMFNGGKNILPPSFATSLVVQIVVPDEPSLQSNQALAPSSEDPGDCDPWSCWHQHGSGKSHLNHLRIQSSVTGGSASNFLDKLREEANRVDKDLEEAKANRGDCVTQERELCKAYHDAQTALRAATARCETLFQSRKFLRVLVQIAELILFQQASYSMYDNRLVPHDKGTVPRILELSSLSYTTMVRNSSTPLTGQKLDCHVGISGNVTSAAQGTWIRSSAQVNKKTFERSSSKADTEILEGKLDKAIYHVIQLSGFQDAWHNCVKSQTWSRMLYPRKPFCLFEHWRKRIDVAHSTLDQALFFAQLRTYSNFAPEVEEQKLSSEEFSISLEENGSGASKNVGTIIGNKSLVPRTFPWNRRPPAPSHKIRAYTTNHEEGLTSRVWCCLGRQYKFNPFKSSDLVSATRRLLHSDMPYLHAIFSNFGSQMTLVDASGWCDSRDKLRATFEEHVDRKLGNTKGWLGFPLTPIHFDLNRTCTDVCNEIENSRGSCEFLLLYINNKQILLECLNACGVSVQALVNDGEESQ
ncbi:uncharacterized protein [Physcomitrium patens]|uniref:Uncharacterized protein n=2 Tax=Physcomitrium patens TaxID=3218 RepID=A0A7I4DQ55_PHYPA|nr:uncharacterized protein LOC112282367 isoform X1 [Physcomitrium patens]XP_024375647.1 uncharacterized protein LOC112282367 isoform X1 [Physcomitrium patens]XP_024375648.1 uncharacterized protein LOC112282367 isoform X1 [Physcomitrium patens]|eukprot:XP_024375646.1 uncharacterized protein LOC112282367 isoform X1 [Physcomitrella patens]